MHSWIDCPIYLDRRRPRASVAARSRHLQPAG